MNILVREIHIVSARGAVQFDHLWGKNFDDLLKQNFSLCLPRWNISNSRNNSNRATLWFFFVVFFSNKHKNTRKILILYDFVCRVHVFKSCGTSVFLKASLCYTFMGFFFQEKFLYATDDISGLFLDLVLHPPSPLSLQKSRKFKKKSIK